MRLIDADAFERSVMFGDAEDMQDVIYALRDFPTAFDPDQVVEQLEKLKKVEQDRSDDCDEDGCGDGEQIYEDGRSQGKFEAFGKAIEIVKGGGVDGN